jgi:hypothetical protein
MPPGLQDSKYHKGLINIYIGLVNLSVVDPDSYRDLWQEKSFW